MARKRLTPNQKAWQREVERINRFTQRHGREGFQFNENIIPERPARIYKKDIQALKQMRGKKLYAQSTYILPSGETVSGVTGRQYIDIQRQLRKEGETNLLRAENLVINNVRDIIDTWQPELQWSEQFAELKRTDKNIANNILNGAIARDGADVVAARIEANAMRIKTLVEYICYGQSGSEKDGGDYAQSKLLEFSQIINGQPFSLTENSAITDFAEMQTV